MNATELRAAVHAWQEADVKASEAYKTFGMQIRTMLKDVGGFATTSDGEGHNKGFCQTWQVFNDDIWPATGVMRVGEVRVGKVAPYRPDVGDCIAALERESRELVIESFRRRDLIDRMFAPLFEKHHIEGCSVANTVRVLVLERIL